MPNKQQKRERDRQDVVLFFELIQIAIGNRAHLSFPPNNIQWNNTFTIASQQSLIGIYNVKKFRKKTVFYLVKF